MSDGQNTQASEQMSEQVSESRFYMWRAIFAVAHADGQVVPDEEAFMHNYLENVPFSKVQHRQLVEDMTQPQEVGEMLKKVTAPADQSEFFYFARLLAYSDGEFDEREQTALGTHLDAQLEKFNLGHLKAYMGNFRDENEIRRAREEEQWEKLADEKVGLGSMIRHFFSLK